MLDFAPRATQAGRAGVGLPKRDLGVPEPQARAGPPRERAGSTHPRQKTVGKRS